MGKLTEFSIFFTNPQAVFFPGQAVEGHVVVKLNEAMKMRGVKLKFMGGARVHWTERHSTGSGKNRRTVTRHYSAYEQYFNFEVLLFGPGNDSTHLQAGHHTYPFSYTLPGNLPSSYESYTGSVRYLLEGVIDKPWKFDHHTRRLLTVLSMLDLNQQPTALQPLDANKSKMLCCLCCKSGPISAQFHIDRSGFVPGDTIYLKADISNLSSRKMAASRVLLIQVTTYHATTKSRAVRQEVARVQRGEIQPGGEDTWVSEPMLVPAVPPSYLAGCNIIDIGYILQLEVDPTGPSFDLELPFEIIIGTIPLRQQLPNYGGFAPTIGTTAPSAPAAADLYSGPGLNPDMAMPPPTYNECVFGKQAVQEEGDNEHTFGDKEFAPVYTYYDWSKQPPI